MLKGADRELARGLTVPDVYRKLGIAQATYYRWRQRHDPARITDGSRRIAGWCKQEADRRPQ
jgi:predicted DNA-binding transcriptional regulator AlpA